MTILLIVVILEQANQNDREERSKVNVCFCGIFALTGLHIESDRAFHLRSP
jgi:hypothetical protein